jgi:alkylation response protein AidB-like acyl-CoA dehydrogenase
MDFRLGAESDQLRTDVRSFLDELMTHEREEQLYRSGTSFDPDLNDGLRERGLLNPDFPVELGGQGRDSMVVVPLIEEIQRADAPNYALATSAMVAKVIDRIGSDELKQRVLPDVLGAREFIALGFSEPEAGSDVAAVSTKAVRDGDEWVIDGQKMFTTNAHVVKYVFLLARTNRDVPNHRGLTTFLVPLDSPGVEIQAVQTLSGERTNITFYSGVRLDDTWRIGEVDRGWNSLMIALQDEHSAGYGGHLQRLVEHVEAWAHETPQPDGGTRIDDPDTRARLARAATELEVTLLLQRRAAWMAHEGDVPESQGPMAKLFSTEALVRASQDLYELVGPDAIRSYFEPSAPRGGRIEHIMRFAIGTTIYAGTSEVQRNIIAQRGLGLPRG